MSWWRDLVVENPMLGEILRLRRRIFSRRNLPLTILAGLGLAVTLGYACSEPHEMRKSELTMITSIEFVLLCLLLPLILHTAIAGERERGSWVMIACAPITKPQIVIGKFLTACIPILAISVLGFLVYWLLKATEFRTWTTYYDFRSFAENTSFGMFARWQVTMILASMSIAAACLWMSARSRSSINSLTRSLALLLTILFVIPFVVTMMDPHGYGLGILLCLHPLSYVHGLGSPEMDGLMVYIGQIVLYLSITIGCLMSAVACLNAPEFHKFAWRQKA